MAYLSRLWLNPLRTGAQRLLRNPQVAHAAVLAGVSRQPVNERVLWRLERREPYRAELLVLTQSLPTWGHLIEQAGCPVTGDAEPLVRAYDPLLDLMVDGQEFAFRLRANPVMSTRSPANPSPMQRAHLASARPRGVRVAHRTVAQQLEWFMHRAPKWGFRILGSDESPALQIVGRDRLVFSRPNHKPGRTRVVLQTATFEGYLQVSDGSAARASLLGGVGPARAYGCGLITLAPLGTFQGG